MATRAPYAGNAAKLTLRAEGSCGADKGTAFYRLGGRGPERVEGGTEAPHRIKWHAMRGSVPLWSLLPAGALLIGCTPAAPVEEAEKPALGVDGGRSGGHRSMRCAPDAVWAPADWPGGNRVAVALSFDFDNETVSLRDNNTTASNLSRGQYGSKAGLPRVLDPPSRRHEIPASFFIPAVSALIYPDDVAEIVADGHEIGVHGWIHERNSLISGEVERELIERAMDTLTEMTGTRPVGAPHAVPGTTARTRSRSSGISGSSTTRA